MTGEVTLFRPSNGTIGEAFHDAFCYRCGRDWKRCGILTRTLIHAIDEPEYPREWISDDDGSRCTAFREKSHARPNRIRDRRQEAMKL